MTKTGRRTAALPMRGRNCPPRFHGRTRHLQRKKGDASATIFGFVSETRLAKRYFVSGTVQGVGYPFFTQRAAEKLGIGNPRPGPCPIRNSVWLTWFRSQTQKL